MFIAVRLDGSPVALYASPRVEIGRRGSSDVVLTSESVLAVRPRWIERRDQHLWLREVDGSQGQMSPGLVTGEGVVIEGVRVRAWLCEDEAPPLDEELGAASDLATSPGRLESLAARHCELARRVAANMAAPAVLLGRLGQGFDRITLGAVVANPSTPSSTLFPLGPLFPAEFWRNPQLPLLLLLDPVLASLSAYNLSLLVSHPSAPLELLRLLASHPSQPVREFAERALRARGA